MAHPYWPLFDLVVRTPRLELRAITDEMMPLLADAAGIDMFPDGVSQFQAPWLERPSPERERLSHQFWWRNRAELSPDHWILDLAVIVDGRPVGMQGIHADNFPAVRSFESGSWLAASAQGRGIGIEMRLAVLHLAFDGFGALEALSGAFLTNPRSMAVSRRLGYEDNGIQRNRRAGQEGAEHLNFRMTADRFARIRRDDVVMEGVAGVREVLGLEDR